MNFDMSYRLDIVEYAHSHITGNTENIHRLGNRTPSLQQQTSSSLQNR